MTVYLDASKPRRDRWLRGAHRADLESDLSAPNNPKRGGRHPLPAVDRWCETLGRWGVSPDTPVVVYDHAQGGLAAARAWWMLRAVGHKAVEVCDATALDGPFTDQPTPAANGPAYPATEWRLPTATLADVDRAREDPQWRVIDARSAPRFRGETEPIDPIAGHIPGATNLPWQDCTDLTAFARTFAALPEQVPPGRTIVHCGSGVTACHTLLQLHRLGLDGAALYVGSWSEWCRQDMPMVQLHSR